MRARLDEMVNHSLHHGRAVPAFTCYDFTTATALVEAAEEMKHSIALLVAPRTASRPDGLRLISALRGLADEASVPVSIQLDHAKDLQVIHAAVRAGADAVLADGSTLDFETNIALVHAASDLVGPDVVLEAELGGLPGDEDKAFINQASGITDPGQVEEFVRRSGAHLLAVSVGNVHGHYKGRPEIRWDVMGLIAQQSQVPLVLHGASGIPRQDIARASSFNVGKINVNTELRTEILSTIVSSAGDHQMDGENLAGLLTDWSGAAKLFGSRMLAILTSDTDTSRETGGFRQSPVASILPN
ncbi:class II fructose-bisphosphate aldolase [Paenarthrobacter sp. NPDC091711]|uniref:class II fructose-bisphosphate aldolase n=1 Tax=Paenarthrobacter sp. NPDC091711 TaxID=3364385 RepID=UPI0037F75D94